MEEGWIKIHRKLLQWDWITDANTLQLFIFLLLKCNHKETTWRGQKVLRGQLITGRKSLSKDTHQTQDQIRTSLLHLKTTNEITIHSTNRFSIITVCNYNKYQTESPTECPAESPASPQQVPTNKKNKNISNNKLLSQKKIFFKESEIFDKHKFKQTFSEWSTEKLKYYYEVVLGWSNEGNKKIDWIATIKNWAAKDEKQGKIKFNIEFEKRKPNNTFVPGERDYLFTGDKSYLKKT